MLIDIQASHNDENISIRKSDPEILIVFHGKFHKCLTVFKLFVQSLIGSYTNAPKWRKQFHSQDRIQLLHSRLLTFSAFVSVFSSYLRKIASAATEVPTSVGK
jgi:hypothetical protein